MKILFILAVAFGLAVGPAHSAPLGGAVVGFFAKMAAGSVIAAAFAQTAIAFGLSAISAALQKRKLKKAGAADIRFDIEIGDDTPLHFSVGKVATAGKRKFIGSWGQNNRYISEVIEYSALPQGFAGLWVGDEKALIYWDQTDNNGTPYDLGHPINNKKDDGFRIWVKVYSGDQVVADPMLVAVFANDPAFPWTAAHIGRGKSYVVITTRYDSDTLTQYPSYLIEPAPLPLYDPRKDSTAGGLGAQRWGNRETYAPSENPAVIAYNIARGVYYGDEWLWGGRNLAAWRLPFDEWVAAMNACDAPVALEAGGFEPAYRCGAEISVDMQPLDILGEIGRGSNMRFAEVGGRLKPLVDLPAASVFAINDADIVVTEGQSFRPFAPMMEVFNAISATYPEPAEKWANKDAPERVDLGAVEKDGGRYLPIGVSYPVTPYANQVQRLMTSQLADYRREAILQFTLPPDAYPIEPLDMVSYTSARNGYVNKRFQVERVSKLPAMRVQVTLREVDPSDYDWQPSDQLPYTITPPAPVVPFVQGIADFTAAAVVVSDAAGRGRRVAIQVSCAPGEVGITDVRVQIRKVGGEVLFDLKRPYDAPHMWHITDVVPATTYQVRGQVVSELTASRAWSDWITLTTADLRITQADLDAELVADLGEFLDWIDDGAPGMGDSWRETREDLHRLHNEALENASEQILAQWNDRDVTAKAAQALQATIDQEGAKIIAIAQAVTALQAVIPGLASADALQVLRATVEAQQGVITAQGSAISALDTNLGTKASASALSELSTLVSDQGGRIAAAANALQSLGILTPSGVAQTLMKMEAQSGGSGVLARIGLKALAGNSSDATRSAALFLEALSNGKSRIIMEADQIFMMVNGNRVPLFVIDGDGLRIHSSLLKIYGDMVVPGTITAGAIEDESMTVPARNFRPSQLILPSHTDFTTLAEVTINRKGKPVELQAQVTMGTVGFQGFLALEVVRDTYTSVGAWHNASHPNGFPIQVSCRGVDMSVGHGPATYTLRGIKLDPSINPSAANANLTISNRYLSVTSYIR